MRLYQSKSFPPIVLMLFRFVPGNKGHMKDLPGTKRMVLLKS